ncbi:MAG TPA: biopolymer transporter ExbD [Myxococcales bacterium]|nr:biopolymer transporter ExbD [Myxococcales bacterium]
MAMSAGGGKGGVKCDINVTPLVDVCLVLLIIFMVVTPMLQRGKDVKLPPAAKQKKDKEKSDPLIVSITPDKRVFVEQDEYPGDEALQRRLASEISSNPDKPILLKGDMTLTFGDVRKVMNVARMAHARGIGLGVEEAREGGE